MARRSKAEDLLDFEIGFYEKLVSAYPDFTDALIPLGDAYTRRGLHDKGLAIDLRLAQLRKNDPLVWYNLACSYSLLKRFDEALEALKLAFTLGYHDFEHLRADPDLMHLRQFPKYRQFLEAFAAVTSTPAPKPTLGGSQDPSPA